METLNHEKLSGHAFISYVREDGARVDRLQQDLERAGVPTWRDTHDLWPGQDWRLMIRRAILDGSLVFLACFSEASHRRTVTYQNEELVLAVEQMRRTVPGHVWLIPVRFDDVPLPYFDLGGGRSLDSLQSVDLFSGHWDTGAARLVSSVSGLLTDIGLSERLPRTRPLSRRVALGAMAGESMLLALTGASSTAAITRAAPTGQVPEIQRSHEFQSGHWGLPGLRAWPSLRTAPPW